jgi:hypothetical protein
VKFITSDDDLEYNGKGKIVDFAAENSGKD